jgi:hypothetical protein
VLPKLRKRHCDGWVGGWVGPLFSLFCFSRLPRRNCVAAGSRFRCRSVLRLWVGDRTGGRVVKKRRRDSERWELDTVRTGYDTNCALWELDSVVFTDCYCERSECQPALEILDPWKKYTTQLLRALEESTVIV